MYDDDESMNDQLICNQCVLTQNKLRGMNPMGLSAPWANSPEVIALQPLKIFKG